MNHVFVLLASLLLRLSGPANIHQSFSTFAECEAPAPTVDPLERAAASRAAYLTDVLQLRYAQTQKIKQVTYAEFQELQWLTDSGAVASRVTTTADIDARYHRQLVRVLSTGQYATLLRLEAGPLVPLMVCR